MTARRERIVIFLVVLIIVLLCNFEFFLLGSKSPGNGPSSLGSLFTTPSPMSQPTSESNINKKKNPGKNVYICITGQLSRLELHNKIKHLFSPLHELGYSLNIGLVLSESTPQFSNKNNGAKMILKASTERVILELENVPGVREVRHFKPDFKDLQFNPKYDQNLGNYTIMGPNGLEHVNYLDNQLILAANNARQFRTLQYCNRWPKLDTNMDFLIRLREDVLIYKLDLSDILSMVQQGAVVTSKCDAWRGINDKLAFASSTRASDFFNIPYQEYLIFDYKKHRVQKLNAETFYKIAYKKHGFKLISTDSLVATKAMTFFNPSSTGANNCSVIGNPFDLSLSKSCPKENLLNLSYSAVCWK